MIFNSRDNWLDTHRLFGKKSERFVAEPDPQQMHLGQVLGELPVATEQPVSGTTVPAHKRRTRRSDFADAGRDTPFFDESKVPVLTIEAYFPRVDRRICA